MIDIDSLLKLKEGESLMILCLDKRHANAVKQRYWRALKKISSGDDFVISIRRYKFNIYVSITRARSQVFLETKNGKIKEIISSEDRRKIDLMREDNISEEEIISSFSEDKKEKVKEYLSQNS